MWEVLDLRHGGCFKVYRPSFIWFLPLRDLTDADVLDVRAGTPEWASTILTAQPELLADLRSLLGDDWARSVGMMEMLATEARTDVLDTEDHESYRGIRGAREFGL
jgi:hypothetical protein